MNIQDLREELQYFYDNQNSIGISIYALLNTTINNNLFKINIEDEAVKSYLKHIKITKILPLKLYVYFIPTRTKLMAYFFYAKLICF